MWHRLNWQRWRKPTLYSFLSMDKSLGWHMHVLTAGTVLLNIISCKNTLEVLEASLIIKITKLNERQQTLAFGIFLGNIYKTHCQSLCISCRHQDDNTGVALELSLAGLRLDYVLKAPQVSPGGREPLSSKSPPQEDSNNMGCHIIESFVDSLDKRQFGYCEWLSKAVSLMTPHLTSSFSEGASVVWV